MYRFSITLDIVAILIAAAILFDEVMSDDPHELLCLLAFCTIMICTALIIETHTHHRD